MKIGELMFVLLLFLFSQQMILCFVQVTPLEVLFQYPKVVAVWMAVAMRIPLNSFLLMKHRHWWINKIVTRPTAVMEQQQQQQQQQQ